MRKKMAKNTVQLIESYIDDLINGWLELYKLERKSLIIEID